MLQIESFGSRGEHRMNLQDLMKQKPVRESSMSDTEEKVDSLRSEKTFFVSHTVQPYLTVAETMGNDRWNDFIRN